MKKNATYTSFAIFIDMLINCIFIMESIFVIKIPLWLVYFVHTQNIEFTSGTHFLDNNATMTNAWAKKKTNKSQVLLQLFVKLSKEKILECMANSRPVA